MRGKHNRIMDFFSLSLRTDLRAVADISEGSDVWRVTGFRISHPPNLAVFAAVAVIPGKDLRASQQLDPSETEAFRNPMILSKEKE